MTPRHGATVFTELWSQLQAAYETLVDPTSRSQYDAQQRHRRQSGFEAKPDNTRNTANSYSTASKEKNHQEELSRLRSEKERLRDESQRLLEEISRISNELKDWEAKDEEAARKENESRGLWGYLFTSSSKIEEEKRSAIRNGSIVFTPDA